MNALLGWRGYAAAAVASAVLAFSGGYGLRDLQAQAQAGQLAAAQLKASEDARRVEGAQAVATYQAGLSFAAGLVKSQTVYRTLTEKVPTYVSPQADAAAVVPVGFVRLLDAAAAARDVVSDPAAQSNDAPSGLALSAVAGSVVGNYGTCNEIRDQLIGLQGWVSAARSMAGGAK